MMPPEINKLELEILKKDYLDIDMPTQHMWSDTQFEIIKKYIEEFEASLDEEHEVGVMLTNFGQAQYEVERVYVHPFRAMER
mgnify:CR=1 FL=1